MEIASMEEFRALVRKAEVRCEICGWRGHSIVAHLRDKHDTSPGQYQNKFPKEQYPDARLCSPIVTEMLKRIDRRRKHTDNLEELSLGFRHGQETQSIFTDLRRKMPAVDPAWAKYGEIPTYLDSFHFGAETDKVLAGLALGKNSVITGPTGCGKTELVDQIHNRLNRPRIRINMTGEATPAKFVGAMRVEPAKGTYFKYGVLPIAMRGGMTLLLDEYDYAPPHVVAVMNPVLEGKRVLYLEETDETIHAAPGFNVIATGNTSGKGDSAGVYTGTEVLNTAYLDRFAIKVEMDYLPRDKELEMLMKRFPREDKKQVEALLKAATDIRTGFKQGQYAVTLSTRKLIDFFEMKPMLGEWESLRATILDWLDDDDRVLIETILNHQGFKRGKN